jgi:hypothetical protein
MRRGSSFRSRSGSPGFSPPRDWACSAPDGGGLPVRVIGHRRTPSSEFTNTVRITVLHGSDGGLPAASAAPFQLAFLAALPEPDPAVPSPIR